MNYNGSSKNTFLTTLSKKKKNLNKSAVLHSVGIGLGTDAVQFCHQGSLVVLLVILNSLGHKNL